MRAAAGDAAAQAWEQKRRWDRENLSIQERVLWLVLGAEEGVPATSSAGSRSVCHALQEGDLAGGQPGLSPPCGYSPGPTPPAGIIDLSQVPHLPVLVPPTPGTPATAMDRLAYLPTAPQPFSSRHSSSPLSPGSATAQSGVGTPASMGGGWGWVAGLALSAPA